MKLSTMNQMNQEYAQAYRHLVVGYNYTAKLVKAEAHISNPKAEDPDVDYYSFILDLGGEKREQRLPVKTDLQFHYLTEAFRDWFYDQNILTIPEAISYLLDSQETFPCHVMNVYDENKGKTFRNFRFGHYAKNQTYKPAAKKATAKKNSTK